MSQHSFRFFRAGGVDQVRFDSAVDIAQLDQLDQKLWLALSCPVKGLEFDERTLTLLDTDNDGRVRVGEILAAIKFCKGALKSLDSLLSGGDVLTLDAIDASKPGGSAILAASREVLSSLGQSKSRSICLADVSNASEILAKAPLNGDGVLVPASADDEALKAVLNDIMATVGATKDVGGADGISKKEIEEFFSQAQAVLDWYAKAEEQSEELLPLGAETAAAQKALDAVAAKIDDFFTRCDVAAFDSRAVAALQGVESELAAVVAKGLSAGADELQGFPIAKAEAGASLPLKGLVNPAWVGALKDFEAKVVVPILGECESLSAAQWAQLKAKLAPFAAYQSSKPANKVESLGIEKLRQILLGDSKTQFADLMEYEESVAAQFRDIVEVEKLIRFQRDLYRLLNNFVSLSDFYDPKQRATFQAGVLYLDNRTFDLCIRVEDAGKHSAMAALSRCYLVYCDIKRGAQSRSICVVVSAGDSETLWPGRNGLFYDRQGQDWDATITKIVDNPISVRQAFFAPYKKFVKMIEDFVTKRAAAADDAVSTKVTTSAGAATSGDKSARRFDPSSVALFSVAISGLASVIGVILTLFFGLGAWMPVAVLVIMMMISGPSMFLAWLKLRQRNIGPLLEANGWAINSKARVNPIFGKTLTHLPSFPEGSRWSATDPFEVKRSPLIGLAKLLIVLLILVGASLAAFHLGWLPAQAEKELLVLGMPYHRSLEKDIAGAELEAAVAAQTKVLETLLKPAQAAVEAASKLSGAEAAADKLEAKLQLEEAQTVFDEAKARTAAARERMKAARDAYNASWAEVRSRRAASEEVKAPQGDSKEGPKEGEKVEKPKAGPEAKPEAP